MPFLKFREEISRWSRRLSGRKHRGEAPSSEPSSPATQPEGRIPSSSKGSFQQPGLLHPVVSPLESKPSPRPCSFKPPLQRFSVISPPGGSTVNLTEGETSDEAFHEAFEDLQTKTAPSVAESSRSSSPSTRSPADWDYTIHTRPAIIQEEVKPHVHTIYQPRRTRSIHFHEHRYIYQPIIAPDPHVLREQHWLQDETSGTMVQLTGGQGADAVERVAGPTIVAQDANSAGKPLKN